MDELPKARPPAVLADHPPDQFVLLVLGETQVLLVVLLSDVTIKKWLKQAAPAASAACNKA